MKLKRILAQVLALMLLTCGALAEGVPVDTPIITEESWWNILLLGTDNRSGSGYGRTDSMIILSVNTITGQAKLTSLMRDLWVPIEGHGHNKLNAASVKGGPDLTMSTINECFGTNLSDYVIINITGLATVIDTIGGIDIDVTEAERKALNKGLFDLSEASNTTGMTKLEESGENVHLSGNQAVAFARIRKIDSDFNRTGRQRTVLQRIASKLKENNALSVMAAITSLLPNVETNLELTELMTLANLGLSMDLDGIEEYRLPADGTYKSGTFDGVWCIKADFDKNAELLHEFIYGSTAE